MTKQKRLQALRERQLLSALAETHADLAAGRFVKESAEAHVARIEKAINPKTPRSEKATG